MCRTGISIERPKNIKKYLNYAAIYIDIQIFQYLKKIIHLGNWEWRKEWWAEITWKDSPFFLSSLRKCSMCSSNTFPGVEEEKLNQTKM